MLLSSRIMLRTKCKLNLRRSKSLKTILRLFFRNRNSFGSRDACTSTPIMIRFSLLGRPPSTRNSPIIAKRVTWSLSPTNRYSIAISVEMQRVHLVCTRHVTSSGKQCSRFLDNHRNKRSVREEKFVNCVCVNLSFETPWQNPLKQLMHKIKRFPPSKRQLTR